MRILKIISALLLGGIFLLSAYAKIISIEPFEIYIYQSSFLGFDMASAISRLLIAAEAIAGIFLISRISFKVGWWIAFILTVAFSLFLATTLGSTDNCFCFGELLELTPVESYAKNAVILILLIVSYSLKSLQFKGSKVIGWAIGVIAVAGIVIASPPDFLVKGRYKPAEHNQQALTSALDSNLLPTNFFEGRKVVAFYSTGCRFCKMASERLSTLIRKNELDHTRVKVVFWGKEPEAQKFFEITNSFQYEYHGLETTPYLDITKGKMPLIMLVNDGEVEERLNYRTMNDDRIVQFLKEDSE